MSSCPHGLTIAALLNAVNGDEADVLALLYWCQGKQEHLLPTTILFMIVLYPNNCSV